MVAKDTSVVAQVMSGLQSPVSGVAPRGPHILQVNLMSNQALEKSMSAPASTEGPSFQGGSPLQRGVPSSHPHHFRFSLRKCVEVCGRQILVKNPHVRLL